MTDIELYYKTLSCATYEPFDSKEAAGPDVLLPILRHYHLRKMGSHSIDYATLLKMTNDYFIEKGLKFDDIRKYEKYLIHFYRTFNSNKKYDVILPYFHWKYEQLEGNIELVMNCKNGIRLYDFCFSDDGISSDEISLYGFKLQLSSRIFHIITKNEPKTMCLFYPATKYAVYYTYKPDEKLECIEEFEKPKIRQYGAHCATCSVKNCGPLVDRYDRFGWKFHNIGDKI